MGGRQGAVVVAGHLHAQGDAGIGNVDDADEGGIERLARIRGQVLEAPYDAARHRAGRLIGRARRPR